MNIFFFYLCVQVKDILYINRSTGKKEQELVPGGKTMFFLYSKKPMGKLNLYLLFKRKYLSQFGGLMMNWTYSKRKIAPFVEEHEMDMNDYIIPVEGYKNFNQFFYRKLQPHARIIQDGLVSSADGKLVAFQTIDACTEFYVKDCSFNLATFLNDEVLAKKYKNGGMCIIRLAPADYHRFHFPADGIPNETKKISGFYYSVSPMALQKNMRIFLQNKREYCTLKTKEFGDVLMCDVGATLTGSIIQTYASNQPVKKGDEKGHFAFGGSTVVLLFEKGKVKFDDDLIENTQNGFETSIKMGEKIGTSTSTD